jgi:HEAT repeat protein
LSKSFNIELRRTAAEMLSMNKSESFPALMRSIIYDKLESTEMRVIALGSLLSVIVNSADDEKYRLRLLLVESLDSEDTLLRVTALEYLCRINDPAAPNRVREIIDNPEKFNDLEIAASVRGAFFLDLKSRKESIRKFLTHNDPTLKIAAIQALSNWGDPESRVSIEVLCASSDKEVSRIAKGAIRNYGRPQLNRMKIEEGKRH